MLSPRAGLGCGIQVGGFHTNNKVLASSDVTNRSLAQDLQLWESCLRARNMRARSLSVALASKAGSRLPPMDLPRLTESSSCLGRVTLLGVYAGTSLERRAFTV